MIWNILAWLLIGALAGWIANMIMGSKGGLLRNIIIGIVGALLGGFILSLFGVGVDAFSFWGILVAIVGACLLIFIGRLLFK